MQLSLLSIQKNTGMRWWKMHKMLSKGVSPGELGQSAVAAASTRFALPECRDWAAASLLPFIIP
jgi:hypothetical protein